MKFQDLSIFDQISYASRQIIVHSIIYYELNKNVIDDKTYDKKAYFLADLIKKYPNEAKQSEYWNIIYDFDGTTGFDLRSRLSKEQNEYLTHIANIVIGLYEVDNLKGRKGK